MKIIRDYYGQKIEIKLTEHKLYQAYCEQEHLFDLETAKNCVDSGIFDFKTITTEKYEELIKKIATQYRRNIDKYGMSHEDALEDASSCLGEAE